MEAPPQHAPGYLDPTVVQREHWKSSWTSGHSGEAAVLKPRSQTQEICKHGRNILFNERSRYAVQRGNTELIKMWSEKGVNRVAGNCELGPAAYWA